MAIPAEVCDANSNRDGKRSSREEGAEDRPTKRRNNTVRLFSSMGEDSLVRIMEYLDRQTALGVLSISTRKSLLHLRFCPVHGSKLQEKANHLPWSCEDCEEYKRNRRVRCPSCDAFDDVSNVRECLGECNQTGCTNEACPSRLTHGCHGCGEDGRNYCTKCSEKLLQKCDYQTRWKVRSRHCMLFLRKEVL